MVEAVRRTKRIVQVGTQRRSHEMFIEAKKLLDGEGLGPHPAGVVVVDESSGWAFEQEA